MSADVICVGEAGWDLVSREELRRPRTFRAVPGGAAVNTARALARIGLRAGICCAVGDDALGAALVDRLRSEGIGVSLVRRSAPRTPVVLVGGSSFMSLRVLSDELGALGELLPRRWPARHVHLGAVLPGRQAARIHARMVELAEQRGATLSIDVNARPRFWRSGGAPPWAIVGAADLVKCSVPDLAAIGLGRGARAVGAMRRRLSASATLIVTDGPRAARAFGPWGQLERSPRSGTWSAALGAGDAFSAGVLAALCTARDADRDESFWRRALDRGHAAARAAMRLRFRRL